MAGPGAFADLVPEDADIADAALPIMQNTESGGAANRATVVSPKGAVGIGQVMPDTARQYGYDPEKLTDPAYNAQVSRTILADLADRYRDAPNRRDAIWAGYNGGPGRGDALVATGDPSVLPKETQDYILKNNAQITDGAFSDLVPDQGAAPADAGGAFDDLIPAQKPAGDPFADLVPPPAPSKLPHPEQPEDSWLTTLKKTAENIPAAVTAGAGQALTGVSEFMKMLDKGDVDRWNALHPDQPISTLPTLDTRAQQGRDITQENSKVLAANEPNVEPGSAKGIVGESITSVAQMAPAAFASLITKSSGPLLAAFGAQSYGQQYDRSIQMGRTPEQARVDAGFSAAAATVPAEMPISAILKPGGKILSRIGKAAFGGAAANTITTALQKAYDAGILDVKMTWAEALDAMKQSAEVGGLIGGLFGIVGHGAAGKEKAEAPAAEKIEPTAASTTPPPEPGAPGPSAPPGPSGAPAQVLPQDRGVQPGPLNPDGTPVSAGGQAIATPGGKRIAGRRGEMAGTETLIPGQGSAEKLEPVMQPPAGTPQEVLDTVHDPETWVQTGWKDKAGNILPLDDPRARGQAPDPKVAAAQEALRTNIDPETGKKPKGNAALREFRQRMQAVIDGTENADIVSVEPNPRETNERNVQPLSQSSGAGAEVLPEMQGGVRQEMAENAQNDAGSEGKGSGAGVRERLSPTRENTARAVQNSRMPPEGANAPPGLQKTTSGRVDLQGAPSGTSRNRGAEKAAGTQPSDQGDRGKALPEGTVGTSKVPAPKFDPAAYLDEARAAQAPGKPPLTAAALAKKIGVSAPRAARVLKALGAAEPDQHFDDALARVRAARAPMPKAETLGQAIRSLGGIKLKNAAGNHLAGGPEIRDILDRNPGLLNNKTGLAPDALREALSERGWFSGANDSEHTTLDDLYEVLGRHQRGEKIYHPASEAAGELHGRQMLDEELGRAGVSANDSEGVAARKLATFRQEHGDSLALKHEDMLDTRDLAALSEEDRKVLDEDYGYEPGADIGAESETAEGPSVRSYELEDFPGWESDHRTGGEEASGDRAVSAGADDFPGDRKSESERPANEPSAPVKKAADFELGDAVDGQGNRVDQFINEAGAHSAKQLAGAREAAGRGKMTTKREQRGAGALFGEEEPVPPKLEETADMFGEKPATTAPKKAKYTPQELERAKAEYADLRKTDRELSAALNKADERVREARNAPEAEHRTAVSERFAAKRAMDSNFDKIEEMAREWDRKGVDLDKEISVPEARRPAPEPQEPALQEAAKAARVGTIEGDPRVEAAREAMDAAREAKNQAVKDLKAKKITKAEADAAEEAYFKAVDAVDTARAAATETPDIPKLGAHVGSWMVVDRATGKAVTEIFRSDRKTLENLNFEKYKAVPADEYLASLNKKPSDYGTKNTVFTADAAQKARDLIRNKLKTQMNSGIDPEMVHAGITLAGYHIEAGARKFADFAKAMLEDLGENARPFLKMWYNAVRDYPGFDAAGMSDAAELTPEAIASAGKTEAQSPDVFDRSANSEQDRGPDLAENDSGEAPVSDEAGKAASGAGRSGDQAVEGRDAQEGGDRADERGTVPVGEEGDSGLRAEEPDLSGHAAGPGERAGGGDYGDEGIQPERIPAETVGRAASESAHVEDDPPQNSEPSVDAPKAGADLEKALPTLFPEQRDDVAFAERRFEEPDGHGVLFTNGTGTGKTFTGGGIIKRAVDAGKDNVLVVAPTQGILDHWVEAAEKLGVKLKVLDDTVSNGKKGPVATTYANFQQNKTLADRDWDYVVADESHTLMSDQNGSTTQALTALRALTNHPTGYRDRARMQLRQYADPLDEMVERRRTLEKMKMPVGDLPAKIEAAYADLEARMKPVVEKIKAQARSKVAFLSATPFAYDKNVDYAEGYLFNYGPEDTRGGYNAGSPKDKFFMQHFGYRMKYNKLTKPEAAVQNDVMERQFHEWLRQQKVLSGRVLTVDKDYDRKFMLVDDGVGKKIDQALKWLDDVRETDKHASELGTAIRRRFDYLARMRLLEAIKATHAVPVIKKHMAMGRKVVVFHDFNEGGGFNPFEYSPDMGRGMHTETGAPLREADVRAAYDRFVQANPYVEQLGADMARMRSPLETLQRAFPDALVYNGTVSKKTRAEAKAKFNVDGGRHNLIVVQSAAGQAGISLHDTTGKHQRVLINLGMPGRPVAAIQIEGRTYRIGQASDAIFRYMNTGTNWERHTFASRLAERAGTAENLALGDRARTLRQSFIDAFNESAPYPPSKEDGRGGKETDRALYQSTSEFQRAKSFYYAQGKKKSGRMGREGTDYYATPEPIGYKMVEWANIRPGDKVLEPSAGHGAIARFFPDTSDRTLVEPSSELASRAVLASPGADVKQQRFEDLHIVNKYDAIVMNPPFGSGGSTAIAHIAKAATHLRDGGRIVALIPEGPAADKKFDAFMESDAAKGLYQVGNVRLPKSTFERAGTQISSRVVILERQNTEAGRDRLQDRQDRDFSDAENNEKLFDRIEHSGIRDRVVPKEEVPALAAAKPETLKARGTETPLRSVEDGSFDLAQTKHTKTGDDLFVATFKNRVERDTYSSANSLAKKYGGYYSAFRGKGAIPGFQFKTAEARDAFVAAHDGPPLSAAFKRGDQSPRTMQGTRVYRGSPGEFAEAEWTPKFDAARAEFEPALRKRLDQVGLEDVRLDLPDRINATSGGVTGETEGIQVGKVIALAMDNTPEGLRNALNHEGIHQLRRLNVIPENAWKILEKRAKAWREKYEVDSRYGDLPESRLDEEGIAHAFPDFLDGKLGPEGNVVKRAFFRVQRFFEAVRNALHGLGFKTAEDVFRQIDKGEFRRTSDEPASGELSLARKKTEEPTEEERKTSFMGKVDRASVKVGMAITKGIGDAIDRVMPNTAKGALDDLREWSKPAVDAVKMATVPMAAGTPETRAAAKDFANGMREARVIGGRQDDYLNKKFTPEQRQRMWDAADEESVALQEGRSTEGIGLSRLSPEERKAVEAFQAESNATLQAARDVGMFKGEGLPSYVPRMVVAVGADGKAARLGYGGDGVHGLDAIGRNLKTTTSSLKQRKYLTREQTEEAARALDPNAVVVRDIRTLPLAMARLREAIAGRKLINTIREMGNAAGEQTISEGSEPEAGNGHTWFTLDHPAFKTYRPKFFTNEETGKIEVLHDENGNALFEKVPIYVRGDFEGPLRAVLTKPSNAIVKTLMNLKGKTMSVIMYSPMMHNAVIWGKALPAAPLKLITPWYRGADGSLRPGLQLYGEGRIAKNDPVTMKEALRNGLDPIGKRYGIYDATGIVEDPTVKPGRSWTAQVLAYVPGLFDKEKGEAVKRYIDKAGDVWHNKFLWDLVGDLQMGLYTTMRDKAIEAGHDPQTAGRMAAHFANRYAGALPIEAMSQGARTIANFLMFSRSFTLTNLGAFKDVVAGLPRDVQAQILRDRGIEALNQIQGTARRKAATMLAMDIVLSHVGTFMAAYAIAWAAGAAFQPPSENEPGKEDRFLIGYQKDGTAIYGRLPTGKVGEDLQDWVGSPVDVAHRKLSPFGHLVNGLWSNDKGFGQKIYDPYDTSAQGYAKNMARVAEFAMESVLPISPFKALSSLGSDKGETQTKIEQILLPMIGITVSKGAPGGPAMGQLYASRDEHEFQVGEKMPEIKEKIAAGDIHGATKMMTELGMSRSYQRFIIRTSKNPRARMSKSQMREFMGYAKPDERERMRGFIDADRARRAQPDEEDNSAPADQHSELTPQDFKAAVKSGTVQQFASAGGTWTREQAARAAQSAGMPGTAAILRSVSGPIVGSYQNSDGEPAFG